MTQLDDYYQQNAEEYFQQTVKVDMGPLHSRFMKHIPENGRVLDAGCGSGRDARIFMSHGFKVSVFPTLLLLLPSKPQNISDNLLMCFVFKNWRVNRNSTESGPVPLYYMYPILNCQMFFDDCKRAIKQDGVLYASFKYGSGENVRDGRFFF